MSSVKSPPEKFSLSVQYAQRDPALPTRPQVRRWVRAAAARAEDVAVTVRFVDSEEGRALNREYRGKDYATNVLSFPYDSPPHVCGDLVICAPLVADEARTQGKPSQAHFAHLIVHGMLHLRGYDHMAEPEAEEMETQEIAILQRLGFPNPYEKN